MWNTKWKNHIQMLPDKISDILQITDQKMFPSIYHALQILATIPVTTCTCERSISGLRRVKTWMRNTMTEDRLNSLCLILFNRGVIIDIEKVIDKFDAANKRRMSLNNVLAT